MENKRLALSNAQLKWENIFRRVLKIMSALLVLIVVGVFITLIVQSWPTIKSLGIGYLWGKVWDPVSNVYGAYPFLIGTLKSTRASTFTLFKFCMSANVFIGVL